MTLENLPYDILTHTSRQRLLPQLDNRRHLREDCILLKTG